MFKKILFILLTISTLSLTAYASEVSFNCSNEDYLIEGEIGKLTATATLRQVLAMEYAWDYENVTVQTFAGNIYSDKHALIIKGKSYLKQMTIRVFQVSKNSDVYKGMLRINDDGLLYSSSVECTIR